MLTFFPKITLEEVVTEGKRTSGRFSIDILERFNVSKEFAFTITNMNSPEKEIVIWRDGKVFVKLKGPMTKRKSQNRTPQQYLILKALSIVLSAYQGTLIPETFALTRIERTPKIAVIPSTPDKLGALLVMACVS